MAPTVFAPQPRSPVVRSQTIDQIRVNRLTKCAGARIFVGERGNARPGEVNDGIVDHH
jgi:hypothetical protein